MSKSDKLEERLFSDPCPKDFTWDELISVMHRSGFKETCTGGSHYMFDHIEDGFRVRISKPHGTRKNLLKYQIEAAVDALNTVKK